MAGIDVEHRHIVSVPAIQIGAHRIVMLHHHADNLPGVPNIAEDRFLSAAPYTRQPLSQ